MYKAIDIANIFVNMAITQTKPISQMKLQKLIYLANGLLLTRSNGEESLVSEDFEAWEFGPVLPSIYHNFKQFGSDPITPENDFLSTISKGHDFESIIEVQEKHQVVIDSTWSAFKTWTAIQLSELTHRDGSAWKKVYDPQWSGIKLKAIDIQAEIKSLLAKD